MSIRENLLHRYPFATLKSLYVTALILSYTGKKRIVIQLLQVLSHKGRAYCVQQINDALKGFVIASPSYSLSWDVRSFVKEPWRPICPISKLPSVKVVVKILAFAGTKDEAFGLLQILS